MQECLNIIHSCQFLTKVPPSYFDGLNFIYCVLCVVCCLRAVQPRTLSSVTSRSTEFSLALSIQTYPMANPDSCLSLGGRATGP